MATVKDEYSNMLLTEVTMSAADTLTFEEIDIGLNIFDKVGLLLQRIEYIPAATTWNSMDAEADYFWYGLCQSNQITALSANDRAIVDYNRVFLGEFGTPGNAELVYEPLMTDFTSLAGGGLLIAPKPLYLFMDTAGFAVAGAVVCRIYFVIKRLKDADYLELIESRRFFG